MSGNTATQKPNAGQPAKEQSPGQANHRTRSKMSKATEWFCHECRNGPMGLATVPKCIYTREDGRNCDHERCYFCTLQYELSDADAKPGLHST